MRISFFGAARTVTGSKYLVECGGQKILVDCGLYQGLKPLRLRNWEEPPFDAKSIDAVILTHAHIDHSGYLPILAKKGFRGPVYCTPGTHDLCKVLLPDSGRIQEEDADLANRKGFSKHKPAKPLFTQLDVEVALGLFRVVKAGSWTKIAEDVQFEFTPAGHIIGSSFVSLSDGRRTLGFSGDLGRPHDLIMKPPAALHGIDYLVVESTYGDRLHNEIDPIEEVRRAIAPTLEEGGVVVVPSFSVGRTQTLLYALYRLKREKRIDDVPIYLDSPMSVRATRVFKGHPSEHRLSEADVAGLCNVARFVSTPAESKALNVKPGPMIIVSASGMATGGRVLHHIRARASDERNAILIVGYQAEGTRGKRLLDGERTLKMHGMIVPISCKVIPLRGFSAHADQKEILDWLRSFPSPPLRTFVTHGEASSAAALKTAIERELSWSAAAPQYGETVDLP